MWELQISCWLLVFISTIQSSDKIPYRVGTICNFEAYYSANLKSINRYFCVPDSHCRKGVHRFPLMRYDGCNRFMLSPQTDGNEEALVCCHHEEILEDWSEHWKSFIYLPGVRSFMMCKHHSHAICGSKGSYCTDDAPDPKKFQGLPTAISKYPHTAIVGYYHHFKKDWIWFCQGAIVSDKFILTVWSCESDGGDEPATNVKIGQSRICSLDHCPDKDDYQNLEIISKYRQNTSSESRHDLALFEVAPVIQFSKNVRPACLFYELNTRQTQGWFARYGKPDRLIKTRPGKIPVFMLPKDEKIIAFKVKAAGEARILFSRTGLPYKKEFNYQIILGANNNSESLLTRSDGPDFSHPPTPINVTTNILNGDQFRGFWIHVQHHEVNVGKEDNEDPFLLYDDHQLEFNLSAIGLSTPNSRGEWVIYDYRTLASLHDFEMENTFSDECKEAYGDPLRYDINEDSSFCAINPKKHFGPCNNDWGGAIQIQLDEFYCMWQIFGVFMIDDPTNCSVVEKPSLFKMLNKPNVLAWIERTIFPNFTITTVSLEQPVCTGPDTSFEGRCLKPFYTR